MATLGSILSTTQYDSHGLHRFPLVNGNFDVWQRNTTFTPNDDTYGADHWNQLVDGNGAWTLSRSTDVPTTLSTYSLKCVNVTLNKQMAIVQFLENIDTKKVTGNTVSLTFAAKTTTAKVIGNLRATVLAWTGTADALTSDVVGTWAGNGTDPTWAASYTAEVAGSNKALTTSWQTFTIEGVSLDTASTNNLAVVIWVDDTTITAGDEFYITQIQMNTGLKALEYRPLSFHDELMRSQRYYEKSYAYATVPGTADGFNQTATNMTAYTTSGIAANTFYKVQKFATPTLTFYASDSSTGSGTVERVRDDSAGGLINVSSPTIQGSTFGYKSITKSGVFTANRYYGFNWVAESEL